MTSVSASDPETPRSTSSSESRPPTSRSLGSSDSRLAAVSTSQSTDPTVGVLASPATREQPHPRIPIPTQTPPRAASASTAATESPSLMSSAQTVTNITADSGLRPATLDTYRYATTPQFPERTTQIPARMGSLIVNATAGITAAPSGPGSSSAAQQGPAHDRHTLSYSQLYSQIAYRTHDSQSQSALREDSSSHSQATWSTTIAEIPAERTCTSTEANSRSSLAGYGSTMSSSGLAAGYSPMRTYPTEHGHVGYGTGIYGSASSSIAVAEPPSYRPPSLAGFTLTPPAAQASSNWRDAVSEHISSPSTAVWPLSSTAFRGFDASSRQRASQWDSSSSSLAERLARTSFSGFPSFIPQGLSPTQTNSPPESVAEASSSPWVDIPRTTEESGESIDSQSARAYPKRTLSTNVPLLSSLTRSALAAPSPSLSSLQIPPLDASSASNVSVPNPTSATGPITAASRVPEPATRPELSSQSPAPFSRVARIFSEPNVSRTRLTVNYPHTTATAVKTGVESPASTTGRNQQTYSSPQHESEVHSPTSSRSAYPDASPEQVHHQAGSPATSQVPMQYSGYVGQTQMGTAIGTGAGDSCSAGAIVTSQSDVRGTDYGFVGTNTGMYSDPYGVGFTSEPGASNSIATPYSVSVATSAPLYNHSYPSSTVLVPASAPAAFPTASTSGAGGGNTHSTRKRNHPCWMCYKSFDRPSTLRKHLLVHTGEKAYRCDICGRRFGVASNLNRHYRRCVAKPVNTASFHRASTSGSGAEVSSSVSTLSPSKAEEMAREHTNPDVRRSERERDGREEPDTDQPSEAPATSSTSESSSRISRVRRRGRSPSPTPLGARDIASESQSSSSSYQLRPAFESGVGQASGSGQVAVATASTSANIGERRPKRRRRAPSPSRWVPDSLRSFSLSPVRTRTSTPLPPVSPGYDAATGTYEERDSYATITDENIDPSGEGSGETSTVARSREERLRNFEYAPYHPCGWTGRLPGPAVVGNDVTNFTKSTGDSGHNGRYSGTGGGGQYRFMYEFSLAAAG